MIPIIDCNDDIVGNGKAIFDAIRTVGCVYLKNFGISDEKVNGAFEMAHRFWRLPEDARARFVMPKDYANECLSGYVARNVERLHVHSSNEIREAYNFCPREPTFNIRVDEAVPGFYRTLDKFCDVCFEICLKLLSVIAENLGLEDKDFFAKRHHQELSSTMLRLLHYPELPSFIEPGTVRCGEHTDFGSLSLVFQDDVGGLEVEGRDGIFTPADPVPSTVFVNTGDLLQIYTAGRITALKHRVQAPGVLDSQYRKERNVVAYFLHPDDQFVVQPIDGSKEYQPIAARQHVLNLYGRNYRNV